VIVAGQGFKDFVVGEVLTSSDVDGFLMQQAVMRFADDGARGSALGTAVGTGVLAEGMVAYLDDINQIQVYSGSSWTSPLPGIGSNVVQAVKTDTLSSTSTTFTAVTGLSVTITPSAATSKVLVIAYVNGSSGNGDGEGASFRLMRGATPIAIGDADGSRDRVTGSLTVRGTGAGVKAVTVSFLDAPATASPTTYSIEGRATAGTFRINRMSDDGNSSFFPRTISSITAIEVVS
jgi:hypothetical protein